MNIRAAVLLAWLVAAMPLAGSCGGDDRDPSADRSEIVAVIESMQRARAANDLPAICAGLARETHRQIGKAGHGDVSTCPADLREILDLVGPGLRDTSPAVGRVDVEGDGATAFLMHNGRPTTAIPLERQDGQWKLVNFFGADTVPPKFVTATPDEPSAYPTPPPTVAPATGSAILASNARGACGEVDATAPTPSGGCVGRVTGGRLDMVVRTAIGAFPLAVRGCNASGRLRIGGDGRFWLEEAGFISPGTQNPCADNRPCLTPSGAIVPWQGRLRAAADGRIIGQMAVCIATCVGRFQGRVQVVAVRKSGAWRLRFDDSPIAAGGATIKGDAETDGLGSVALQKT